MAKEILGHITCPHCGNKKASVHQNAGRNSKALYYRCYPDDSDQCGTIQPSLAGGQKFIRVNMRPLSNVEKHIEADAAAANARVEQLKASEKIKQVPGKAPEKKVKSGFMSLFTDGEESGA